MEEVRERLDLEKVLLVVASVPPHKERVSDFDTRCELTRLAVEDIPCFEISKIENERPGKSYSVETLRALMELYPRPRYSLFFIIGADSFFEIQSWKSYPLLPELAHLVVLNRPGFPSHRFHPFLQETFPGFQPTRTKHVFRHPTLLSVFFLATTLMDISSTDIRRRVQEGRSIRFLVTGKVRQTILNRGLYRS